MWLCVIDDRYTSKIACQAVAQMSKAIEEMH